MLWLFYSALATIRTPCRACWCDKPAPAFSLVDLDGQRVVFGRAQGQAGGAELLVDVVRAVQAGARRAAGGGRASPRGAVPRRHLLRRARRLPPLPGEAPAPATTTSMDDAGRVAIDYGVAGVPETFFIAGMAPSSTSRSGPVSAQGIERLLAATTRPREAREVIRLVPALLAGLGRHRARSTRAPRRPRRCSAPIDRPGRPIDRPGRPIARPRQTHRPPGRPRPPTHRPPRRRHQPPQRRTQQPPRQTHRRPGGPSRRPGGGRRARRHPRRPVRPRRRPGRGDGPRDRGLRCPVCQGLSVADSTSNAAVLMQRRIQRAGPPGYSQGRDRGLLRRPLRRVGAAVRRAARA
jgi:hypothetical protein